MSIFDSLGPVILLIGLGAFLVKIGFLKPEILKGLNDLAYWVGLPAFIFYRLAGVPLRFDDLGPLMIVFWGGTAAAVVAGAIVFRLLRLPRASWGTFIQASFRGNLAFIGLPVVVFAFSGIEGNDLKRTQDLALLALGPIMIVYNIVAVFALYASHAGTGPKLILRALRQLVTNPLIVATVAGLLVASLGWTFPLSLERSLEALSRLALPLALLCIGGSLMVLPVKGSLGAAVTASLLKVAVAPVAGYAIGVAFGIAPWVVVTGVIYLACPTAAASYVLARQLGGDETLAASTVVLSTLLGLLSLSAAVALL